ncbi:PAS domain-containing hybrid sensor histidine kinase/response regulator [Salinimonas iocasae]|uniref:histidine kinase n=1 Tax=Salinimonas iocasae TaxID=2572577 RepID=A0A5B7YIW7_9ALTE|nr:ATP-binding protein [Salinimonas iocasae]QCZ95458.1 response regulator [Salinimonas iocasae]
MIPENIDFFENAACGLLICGTDGAIVRVNKTFYKWLGYSESEFTTKSNIDTLFTLGSRFYFHAQLTPLLQLEGAVSEFLLSLKGKNGERVPMLVNAAQQIDGHITYNSFAFFLARERHSYEQQLVTARESAENSSRELLETQKTLKENQYFLGLAMKSAKMGVWNYDLVSSRIHFSEELLVLLGLSKDCSYHKPQNFYELIHPDDLSQFDDAINTAIEKNSDYEVEFRLKHSSGSWLSMESRGNVIFNSERICTNILSIFIDISEHKNSQKELADANKQLAEADRKKDEFLATLGHELRNPLAPIRNVLKLIEHSSECRQNLNDYYSMLNRHMTQIEHIVDDLLEVTRISRGRLELKRTMVDICEVTRMAIESSSALIEAGNHTLDVTFPSSTVMIYGDPTRLNQIIVNLLSNAAKYTPKGGHIRLSVQSIGTSIEIRVKDSGIGIPPEKLRAIFNMFTQLEPASERGQGGLGIGLALVKQLVEMHEGHVEVYSPGINEGTEFTVTVPIAPSSEPIEQPASEEEGQSISPKRILIVDDNEDAADSLGLLLEFDGHIIKVAYSGKKAIEVTETFRPSVILSDIGLPDISGYEVAKILRRQEVSKGIYMAAISGWGSQKDKQRALEAGFDQHFTKPLNLPELKSALRKIPL